MTKPMTWPACSTLPLVDTGLSLALPFTLFSPGTSSALTQATTPGMKQSP